MDEQEERWADLLMESVEQMHQQIRFTMEGANTVEVNENALLHLMNRAEALVELLRRREPQE